jgi:hypothetical protein
MISHCVGGSSFSTGEKFWDKTCLGSVDGFIGGSMKLFMMSSNVLINSDGNDGSCFLVVFLRLWVVVVVVVVGGGVGRVLVVVVFSV